MIEVTRLDGRPFTLNADLVELIESHPDTYIRLVNGNSYLVRESREEVVRRVIAYRQQICQPSPILPDAAIGTTRRIANAE